MKIKRTCSICGISYYAELNRLKLGRQTTCSRTCSYELRRRKMFKRIKITCVVCGKDFYRAPSKIKAKYNNQFCSRECHYAGRRLGLTFHVVNKPYKISKEGRAAWIEGAQKTRKIRIERDNYRHSETTKAILSHKTSQAISEGRIPVRSRLEDKVGMLLTELGVSFIRQKTIRCKTGRFIGCFDFYIPARNLALEVQGRFWHSDPRFYPNGPIYPIQKRNAIAWKRKLAAARLLGIEIREIWEDDLAVNPTKAITTAIT